MDDLEMRIAKIEGRIFAHNAVLALLVHRAIGHTAKQLDPARDVASKAVERFYTTHQVTDFGHVALQTALQMVADLLSEDPSPPKPDRP